MSTFAARAAASVFESQSGLPTSSVISEAMSPARASQTFWKRRSTAARRSKGKRDHSGSAFLAAAMAVSRLPRLE
jgi:hypothetical protein